MPKKLKVSIIGVTGYTGLELLRLLLAHPFAQIVHLTSRQYEDENIGHVYPHLKGYELKITNTEPRKVAEESDVVFLCLPHKTAQDTVAAIHDKTRIIDLSADYRLDDAGTYEKYYGLEHNHPELLDKAVYGAPEFHRDKIATAELVSNPGCFALLAQLMLTPFAGQMECADIMAVTGSSGSGKDPKDSTHHPIRNYNMKSYGINTHRHIPEILRTARLPEDRLNFVPTSGPFTRGIFATAYIQLKDNAPHPGFHPTEGKVEFYKNEPFIRIQEEVALANVIGSNYADLSYRQGHEVIIAQGALDNLVKGAAGCAVQNMNIMCGIEEVTGLTALSPLYP